jgi:hypothetical protein
MLGMLAETKGILPPDGAAIDHTLNGDRPSAHVVFASIGLFLTQQSVSTLLIRPIELRQFRVSKLSLLKDPRSSQSDIPTGSLREIRKRQQRDDLYIDVFIEGESVLTERFVVELASSNNDLFTSIGF